MTSTSRTAAAAAAAALALAACDPGFQVDLERMMDQARADTWEATAWFEDGRVMRAPPPGTVASETLLGPTELVSGVAGDPPAYVDRLPLPVTRSLLARGRERFEIVCAACHGVLGDGRTKVARMMSLRRPPSLHDPVIRAFPPGRIFQVVSDGYGLMPSFRGEISAADRWAIVGYVRALQRSQSVSLDALPPAIRSEAEEALR